MKIFNLVQTWFNDDYVTEDDMFATRVVCSTASVGECLRVFNENFEKYKEEYIIADLNETSEFSRDVIFYDETTDLPVMRMEIIESEFINK